jgi:glycosyltransferase involved in cell wall biosynthesis
VPPSDVDALRHSINLLLSDANLRARYGAGARKRVETEFSRGTMLRRTRDLYDSVLAGGELHERAGHRQGVAAAT